MREGVSGDLGDVFPAKSCLVPKKVNFLSSIEKYLKFILLRWQ